MKIIQLLFFSLLFVACNVNPQPINYGVDACSYCDMTIVDKQHASQLVTSKGKAFKYDAIECLVHSLQDEFDDTEMAHRVVSNLENPGEMIDATSAFYLVSEAIQSPMGANLSAFPTLEEAQKAQEKFTGKVYTWEEIQDHLRL